MASVKENLIAAKALIDTPDKFVSRGSSVFSAVDLATCAARGGNDRQFQSAVDALYGHMDGTESLRSLSDRPHANIMAIFDRAIAAQDGA